MLRRLDTLDRAIAETEVRITEQAHIVSQKEARGRDTTASRQMLRIVETLLVEYRRAREAIVEAQRLVVGPPAP